MEGASFGMNSGSSDEINVFSFSSSCSNISGSKKSSSTISYNNDDERNSSIYGIASSTDK